MKYESQFASVNSQFNKQTIDSNCGFTALKDNIFVPIGNNGDKNARIPVIFGTRCI